jgi:hypothetical protein
MTLFGQSFDGQALFGLLSLLAVLALWIVSLNRERLFQRWLKDRQARPDGPPEAERAPDGHEARGPWG